MADLPIPLDPAVAQSLQAGYADGQALIRAAAVRSNAGDAIVLELARQAAAQNADLNSKSASENQVLITTAAAGQLLGGTLAQSILQQRSAGGQPQASADQAGVNSGGPATK